VTKLCVCARGQTTTRAGTCEDARRRRVDPFAKRADADGVGVDVDAADIVGDEEAQEVGAGGGDDEAVVGGAQPAAFVLGQRERRVVELADPAAAVADVVVLRPVGLGARPLTLVGDGLVELGVVGVELRVVFEHPGRGVGRGGVVVEHDVVVLWIELDPARHRHVRNRSDLGGCQHEMRERVFHRHAPPPPTTSG
jgi:hypothetical protein